MMKFRCLIILIVVSIFSSCNSDSAKRIPERKFENLLYDIYVADAIIEITYNNTTDFFNDSISFFTSVIEKHGYERRDFDSTMAYYTLNEDEFTLLYKRLIDRLHSDSENLTLSEQRNSNKYSKPVEIWDGKKSLEAPGDGEQAKGEFLIPTQGLGVYIYTSSIRNYSDDQSLNPKTYVSLYYDNGSSYGNLSQYYSKSLPSDDNYYVYKAFMNNIDPRNTHIKGALLNHEDQDSTWVKHADANKISIQYIAKLLPPSHVDSLPNLWNTFDSWNLPLEGDKNTIDFKIPTQGLGIYTLKARILLKDADMQENPHMEMSFTTQQDLSNKRASKSIKKDGLYNNYTATLELKDTNVVYVEGSILSHSEKNGDWHKEAIIDKISLTYLSNNYNEMNLWNSLFTWNLPNDGNTKIDFRVPVKSGFSYVLKADITVFEDDKSEGLRAYAALWNKNKSGDGRSRKEISVKLDKKGKKQTISMTFDVDDKKVTHIVGALLDYSGKIDVSDRHVKVENISVFATRLSPKKAKLKNLSID